MTAKKAKRPKLGSGARFKSLVKKLKKKGATNPGALAAWIGAKKFSRSKMTKMAATSRRKSK